MKRPVRMRPAIRLPPPPFFSSPVFESCTDFSFADARSFVASFTGPIQMRTARKGDVFLRFTTYPTGKGRFLTLTRYRLPLDARLELHLPFTHRAVCFQHVRARRRTLILQGHIRFGRRKVQQMLVLDLKAFSFSRGVGYSKLLCRPRPKSAKS